jgi:hypothetical protein
MKRWPLFSIAGASLVLIVVRIIWPTLKIDNTSLILLGIATVALLVAFLPITHIKWGEFEANLDRALDAVDRKVKATEQTEASMNTSKKVLIELDEVDRGRNANLQARQLPAEDQKIFDEYIGLVNSPASDIEKIVAATILLEKAIAKATTAAGILSKSPKGSPRAAINQLAQLGVITRAEGNAFEDAWTLRNKIVHEGIKPTSEQTARFLDILWRLIEKLA